MDNSSMNKKFNEVSKDEIECREYLREIWHIKPTRKATRELERQIKKVLEKLGVDTSKDEDSVKAQMDFLNIWIHCIDEKSSITAAGIYFSAYIKGEIQPYAYIGSAIVRGKEYTFPITYWLENKLEEDWKKLEKKEG